MRNFSMPHWQCQSSCGVYHGVTMYVNVSVSGCLYVSFCVTVSVSMSLSLYVNGSLMPMFLVVSVCQCVCQFFVSMCLYVIMFVCQCFCVKMLQVHLRPDSWPSGWCRPLKRPTNHPQHWQPDYCKNPHLLTCKIRSLNSRGTCICMRLALMLKWYVRTRLP